MPLTVTCPACGYSRQAPDNFHGQIACCPKCSQKFRATEPEPLDVIEVVGEAVPIATAVPAFDSRKVGYNAKNETFAGTLSAVMKLAVRAVNDLGYRIDNANESLGLLSVQTGMTWSSWAGALCSLTFEECGENRFRARVSTKANQSGGQIFAPDLFGELKGKATKVIDRMAELAD